MRVKKSFLLLVAVFVMSANSQVNGDITLIDFGTDASVTYTENLSDAANSFVADSILSGGFTTYALAGGGQLEVIGVGAGSTVINFNGGFSGGPGLNIGTQNDNLINGALQIDDDPGPATIRFEFTGLQATDIIDIDGLGLQSPGGVLNRNVVARGTLNLGAGGTVLSPVNFGQVDLGDNGTGLDSIYSGVTGFTEYTFELDPVADAQFNIGHLSALRVEITSAIPEPGTLTLLGLAGIAVFSRRRR